jgi:hypothetical protein
MGLELWLRLVALLHCMYLLGKVVRLRGKAGGGEGDLPITTTTTASYSIVCGWCLAVER